MIHILFILTINKHLQIVYLKERNFDNTIEEHSQIDIYNITKISVPNWIKHIKYEDENIKTFENKTQYRIVLIEIHPNLFYFEKNGTINICKSNFFKTYNYEKINKIVFNEIKNLNFIEKLNEYYIQHFIVFA